MILLFSVKLGWLPPSRFWKLGTTDYAGSCSGNAEYGSSGKNDSLQYVGGNPSGFRKNGKSKGTKRNHSDFKACFQERVNPHYYCGRIAVWNSFWEEAVLTEVVFSIPGIGRLMIEGNETREIFQSYRGVYYS